MPQKKLKLKVKQKQWIEAIIYILAIIVVIFANLYGSIYMTMIPLLMILGIVGKIIFDRPITTTTFGIVVSICIYYTKSNHLLDNLVLSMVAGLNIALGELLGKYIALLVDHLKKKTKKKREEIVKQSILAGCIFVVAILVHFYTNGNIFVYEKCKETLNDYLSRQDEYQSLAIVNAKYRFLGDRHFVFRVRNQKNGNERQYIVYLKNPNIVSDVYKQKVLTENNNRLATKLLSFFNQNHWDEKYAGYQVTMELTEQNEIKLLIARNETNVTDEKLQEFASNIISMVEQLKSFEQFDQIEQMQLEMKCQNLDQTKLSTIIMQDYLNHQENQEKYILDSFEIEYIDGK